MAAAAASPPSKPALRHIDSHSHVWTTDIAAFPPQAGVAVGDADAGWSVDSWTGEDLLRVASGSGVGKVVLIGHGMVYGYDNSYMLECVRRHPRNFRVVAQIDDRRPSPDIVSDMRSLLLQGVTGFRLSPAEFGKPFGRTRDDWLHTDGMRTMWETAAETRQAMCGLVNMDDLDGWEELVAAHPRTVAVIDHFCRIGVDGSVPQEAVQRLCKLAEYSNLHVKLSAFYALGQATPPYDDMLPFVRQLVDAFGSERVMWGSDCPYQLHQHNPPFNPNAVEVAAKGEGRYDDSISVIRDRASSFLSTDEQEDILSRTAQRIFFDPAPEITGAAGAGAAL